MRGHYFILVHLYIICLYPSSGNFLENDFWTTTTHLPPPITFVHRSHKYHINFIGHVAAAPGPLACPSRSARLHNLFYLQRSAP